MNGFEKSPVHVKHGKYIFVPRGEYSRMGTINLGLINQKGDDKRTQKISLFMF